MSVKKRLTNFMNFDLIFAIMCRDCDIALEWMVQTYAATKSPQSRNKGRIRQYSPKVKILEEVVLDIAGSFPVCQKMKSYNR